MLRAGWESALVVPSEVWKRVAGDGPLDPYVGGGLAINIHRLKVLGLEMSLTELHRKKLFKTGMVIIIASL